MCLERLCLFASSFPEHLYVFVVLMNGTKVSGGPVKGGGGGGRGGCEREQPKRGRSGRASAEWSVAMKLTVGTEDSENNGDLPPQLPPFFSTALNSNPL